GGIFGGRHGIGGDLVGLRFQIGHCFFARSFLSGNFGSGGNVSGQFDDRCLVGDQLVGDGPGVGGSLRPRGRVSGRLLERLGVFGGLVGGGRLVGESLLGCRDFTGGLHFFGLGFGERLRGDLHLGLLGGDDRLGGRAFGDRCIGGFLSLVRFG